MSSVAKQIFLSARLPGFSGRGDKYLGDIAQDLQRVLWKTQLTFAHPTCRLPDVAWSEVATEHGAESIAESFLLRDGPSELVLEFLLRRYKGPFFRKRYPSLAHWQPGE
jgi:hypothetical protein